ncbi:MAG: energy transducer TonB [Chitinophagales bacterium]
MLSLVLGILLILFGSLLVGGFVSYFLMTGGKSEDQIAEGYSGSAESQSVFIKKYPEADINKVKNVVLAFGTIAAIALPIYALSWAAAADKPMLYTELIVEDDFEIEPPQTEQVKPPPPPPPPPVIEVVEDDEILEDEPEIEDIEIEEDEEVEFIEEPEEEVVVEQEIFKVVEDMPLFGGCETKGTKAEKDLCHQQALMTYLSKITYPPMAKDADIEGKVFIHFVIDETGKVTGAQVAKGADKLLNDAALKHVQAMPDWEPGKQRGKTVKVEYVVPINFKLQ